MTPSTIKESDESREEIPGFRVYRDMNDAINLEIRETLNEFSWFLYFLSAGNASDNSVDDVVDAHRSHASAIADGGLSMSEMMAIRA